MTNTALSTSRTDVNNAINGGGGFTALSDGDTCIVPAGSSTWTTAIAVSKNITIQGAGVGVSNITRDTTGNDSPSILNVTLDATGVFKMIGFTWHTVNKATNGIVQINSNNNDGTDPARFRVTACEFLVTPTGTTGSSNRGLDIGAAYGLIDHCHFITSDATGGQMVTIDRNSSFNCINTWHTPQAWGDQHFTVIEDSFFDGASVNDGAIDAYDGTRITFRHNVVRNTVIGTHGYDSANRSSRSLEVYDNVFYSDNGTNKSIVYIRGGGCLNWGNISDSSYSTTQAISYYASDHVYVRNQAWAPSSAWGSITSGPNHISASGLTATGSAGVDGNTITSGAAQGYPCLDQPGRGSFPSTNTGNWPTVTTGYSSGDYEALDPVYVWNNTRSATVTVTGTWPSLSVVTSGGSLSNNVGFPVTQTANYVTSGVDYVNDNTSKPGYTPLVYPHPLQGVVSTGGGGKKIIRRRR